MGEMKNYYTIKIRAKITHDQYEKLDKKIIDTIKSLDIDGKDVTLSGDVRSFDFSGE